MDKNTKILCCILGSAILTLLNSPVLQYSRLALFGSGYGGNLLGELMVRLTNIVSFMGFILLMAFSIILIINNIRR